jgi:DNA-binding transcriptional MocR family regulator
MAHLDFPLLGLLAANRGISRSTVRLAFSKLHAEGYLRSEPGSGTFVANLLPETFLTADQPRTYHSIQRPIRTSDRVRAIPDGRVGNQFDLGATGSGAGVSLVPSIPAVDEFPMAVWERLRAQVLATKVSTCYAIHRIAVTPTCARQLQRTYATSGPRAVMRIRS